MLCQSLARSVSSEVFVDDVKRELRSRYARGEQPAAWEYLERYGRLRENSNFAVSLIYEEFCLLEEAGECPDPEEFCQRYPGWRDSLEVQLRCHRELSGLACDTRSAQSLPEPGEDWHGFRIDSILGRGGTSIVYLAYEGAMGDRPVALKVSPDRGPEPAIIGCLDHPRIMPAFSVRRDAARGLRGLCMPFRSGAPLDALVRHVWPLRDSHGAAAFGAVFAAGRGLGPTASLDRPGWLWFPATSAYEQGVAWIVLVVAQAVSYIHSRGIIHCDLKPSNVYVGERDGPLLFDFGFARSRSAGDPLAGGTVAYMAPEQLRAFVDPHCWSEVGPAADIYALGLTLVELLLGMPPDTHPSTSPAPRAARELLSRRLRPDWLARTTLSHIPHALQQIVERCLAPSPEQRYAEASDLVQALARFIALSLDSSGPPKLLNDELVLAPTHDMPRMPERPLRQRRPPDTGEPARYRDSRSSPPALLLEAQPNRTPLVSASNASVPRSHLSHIGRR